MGIAGSITHAGFESILDILESNLSESSCLFDVGHGLGIPFYILHNRRLINNFIGCEICPLKAWKSTEMRRILEPFFIKISKPLSTVSIKLLCCSVECLANLDTGLQPATHVYAAWEGWSPASMEALGTLFSRTPTTMYIYVRTWFSCKKATERAARTC